jgi:hypothetical protein
MAMAARAMVTTTRLEGKQQHPMVRVAGEVRVARVLATVMRVVGDEEAMATAARAVATATLVADEQWRWQQRW